MPIFATGARGLMFALSLVIALISWRFITGGVEASYLKYGVVGSLKFDGDGKLVCRVCQSVISGDQLGR